MNNHKKIRIITFRVTETEHALIQNAAAAADDDPNNWCRRVALKSSRTDQIASIDDRLICTEIAGLRYLFQHGFRHVFSGDTTKEAAWKIVSDNVEKHVDELATDNK
jgi:hypothetical protein